ncbi:MULTISPECIES: DUF5337 domain-containing protein [Roseobacter]|uniref:DUF5337 domain-containing protein n=1 Tax=Roseobacter litoralis (strain ATCC 49566 / DSM 6996 / JCM 21268 / NBRC 15278 / OCh 149) TaxID=391595 RepID=F7ZCP6_ROSLO|nr:MULTISPECIES: DUF5337 domain-containing protein [Roseobacter]AEI94470.1 hypothetical protein RLO149_c025020 [Roseobacter litoralis Och 149]GIT87088.1 hypothetical protein ROBYS_21040 [Roseobacter sp. OBYS 0001]
MSAQDQTAEARDRALAKKGRMVSLVIVGTMVAWVLSLWLAPKFGLTARHAILLDFLALAALAWSFIVSLQIKRARKAAQNDR